MLKSFKPVPGEFFLFLNSVKPNLSMTEKEFEKIFREYFDVLSNIAYNVVHDEDTAKDLVQQVYLKLWQKKDKLQIRGKVKSYLHRAVVNTCLNYIEKNKKLSPLDETVYNVKVAEADTSNQTPVEEVEKGVRQAIELLPEKCRIVFSLSRFSGMKNKEIAEYLGISIKSVEKHIGKALKQLRISLKPLYKSTLIILIVVLFINIVVGYLNINLSYL
jgi:RNA polymerase sigma-70 factor (ECF subfamily)